MIKAVNIFKKYEGHQALKGVSFEIPENTIFGLLGPNGAGKTTFLRILTQIYSYDSGQIFFKNELLSPRHLEHISYLPEERGLYKKMKVREELIYLAQLKGIQAGEAKKRIDSWLEKFQLTHWKNNPVEDLSKGMQQKVQFILSVIAQPKLLILDEPFSGFDPVNAEMLTEEIIRLKKNGCTILFSTHRMDTVEELCDNIVFLNEGKKMMGGSVEEIKKEFKKNIYCIEGTGTLEEKSKIYKILSFKKFRDGRFSASVSLSAGNENDLLKELMQSMKLTLFKEYTPSVKDIFISLSGAHPKTE
jgi:ABC-2 type transport system ATP-binding protein